MAKIVVGYDGSKPAGDALCWAADEAERRGVDVLVIESWDVPLLQGPSWVDVWDDLGGAQVRARDDLEAAIAAVALDHPGVAFSSSLVTERPARVLLDASRFAELVVVGARGRGGFGSLLLGSVSRRVAAKAASSVIVVRGDPGVHGDVVVGVDGSAASRLALAWAADEARRLSCRLRVVLAWSDLVPEGRHGPEPLRAGYTPTAARRVLRTVVDEVLGPEPGLDVALDAVQGPAARALLERADDAALLVVGPYAAATHSRLDLGSVTVQLLHHALCPLAIVRAAPQAAGI